MGRDESGKSRDESATGWDESAARAAGPSAIPAENPFEPVTGSVVAEDPFDLLDNLLKCLSRNDLLHLPIALKQNREELQGAGVEVQQQGSAPRARALQQL